MRAVTPTRRAELALVPPVELAEDDLMIGSSNLEAAHGKMAYDIRQKSPPLKQASSRTLLNLVIASTPPTPCASVSMQNNDST